MNTPYSAALTLTVLVLSTGYGRADWMPTPVTVSVSQLKNGLYRYDYTVTNTDNRYPANSYDPYLGKVVPYAGSFIFDFKLSGLLISPTGNNDEIARFLKLNPALGSSFDPINGVVGFSSLNVTHGQSFAYSLISPNAPGMVDYDIRTGYVGYYGESSGGTSGEVLGPQTAASPEPGTCVLLMSGALIVLAARRVRSYRISSSS